MVLGGLVVSLCVGVTLACLYQVPSSEPLLRAAAIVLPLPAIRVGNQRVNYRTYMQYQDGWMQAYGQRDAATQEQIRALVLQRLVQDVRVRAFLVSESVTVDAQTRQILQEMFAGQYADTEAYEAAIKARFGWTPEQFSAFVVEPLARVRVANQVVQASSVWQAGSYQVISDVRAQSIQNPDAFADVVTQMSGSLSSADAGELGLQAWQNYPEPARRALQETEEGAFTQVIEFADQWVFYRVLERTEQEDLRINAQELSVAKRDVYAVLQELATQIPAHVYLPTNKNDLPE